MNIKVGFTIVTGNIQRVGQEKENAAVYVYDRAPYYDPSKKNMKYHYKYVGKDVYGKVSRVRSVLPRESSSAVPSSL